MRLRIPQLNPGGRYSLGIGRGIRTGGSEEGTSGRPAQLWSDHCRAVKVDRDEGRSGNDRARLGTPGECSSELSLGILPRSGVSLFGTSGQKEQAECTEPEQDASLKPALLDDFHMNPPPVSQFESWMMSALLHPTSIGLLIEQPAYDIKGESLLADGGAKQLEKQKPQVIQLLYRPIN